MYYFPFFKWQYESSKVILKLGSPSDLRILNQFIPNHPRIGTWFSTMIAYNSCYHRTWVKGHDLAWVRDVNGMMSELLALDSSRCTNSGWRASLALHKATGLWATLGTKWELPVCMLQLQHKNLSQGDLRTLLIYYYFQLFFYCSLVAKSCPTLWTPWAVDCWALLSMGYSRQKYWSGLPFPSPGDLPDSGVETRSLETSLSGRFFTAEPLLLPIIFLCILAFKETVGQDKKTTTTTTVVCIYSRYQKINQSE